MQGPIVFIFLKGQLELGFEAIGVFLRVSKAQGGFKLLVNFIDGVVLGQQGNRVIVLRQVLIHIEIITGPHLCIAIVKRFQVHSTIWLISCTLVSSWGATNSVVQRHLFNLEQRTSLLEMS